MSQDTNSYNPDHQFLKTASHVMSLFTNRLQFCEDKESLGANLFSFHLKMLRPDRNSTTRCACIIILENFQTLIIFKKCLKITPSSFSNTNIKSAKRQAFLYKEHQSWKILKKTLPSRLYYYRFGRKKYWGLFFHSMIYYSVACFKLQHLSLYKIINYLFIYLILCIQREPRQNTFTNTENLPQIFYQLL